MSEHASPTAVEGDSITLETGLEAFRSSPEFDGPVEDLDDHEHANDHFAHIYETDAERFSTAVPFVRHGLEQDECVLYIVEAHREPEVRAALRDGGIDVDAALDAGQLTFQTPQETYLRNDSFDPDEMLDYYADTIEDVTAEYEALRIVSETSWLDPDIIPFERFMEYEAKINRLFDAEDCLALCQHDRDRFPPEVVRHIVESHPYLIYDGVTCHNVYYTPPAEIFDDDPAREVDRMLGTLRDRTTAKVELQRRDRFLQSLYQITADQTRSFEEKIDALLDLGCEQFDLDIGGVNRIDPAADHFEVEYINGDHDLFEPGAEFPLSDTYCQAAADIEGAALVSSPNAEGVDDISVFKEFGIEGYIGTYIPVDGGMDRTLGFLPAESKSVSFSEQDRTYIELMGQWLGYEFNRRHRERFLRECYEITSDPDVGFEEKLDALFEFGQERFGLDVGGIAKIDPETDYFEVETVSGDHDHLVPGTQYPLSETYCRLATEDGETAAVSDPVDAGFEGKLCYERFGVQTYLGTHLAIAGDTDRTFWFLSTEPRQTPITDEERTFIDLMGQWVEYELNRRQREEFLRECYEITSDPGVGFEAKVERLLDLGRDWFDLDMGGLHHLPSCDDAFRLEQGVGLDAESDADQLITDPGDGCYCRQVVAADEPVGRADVRGTDWEGDEIYEELGVTSYLGTTVSGGGAPYGTLWFGSTEPRDREFSETERTFIDLMGQWTGYELERRDHKQSQRELYEIIADQELGIDEKFERLLALGCEYLDLPVGMLTRQTEDAFAIERMHGTHPDLGEGTCTPPLTDNYCRRVVDTGSTVAVADAGAAGWDGDALYHEFGLETYAGVQLTVGNEPYGTICFTDVSPRETEFTEAEETFLELMGQCVSYELERNHREADLEQKNERLESFASMLAHELRNPVAIGQIYSQQLGVDEDAEAVEYVTEAFDRVEDMIDVMLMLTRGRKAIGEQAPIDLGAEARAAWADVDAPDAVLDVTLDQTIQADETYIRHLFRNLFENSVEHGGSDVTVTVGGLEDAAGFYVADDGTGIPPEDRETIFNEGYTTAADNGGTGLGLAFVEKLAEVYEWDCTVTESAADGARFEFRNVF